MTALALTISEAEFQSTVIDLAKACGWMVAHFRPAQTQRGRWVTPMTGNPGWPDLALARNGVFYAVELKRHGGKPTPGQLAWLAALGGHGRLWAPTDWREIVDTLTGRAA
jgi:hypothetical protein